MGFVTGFAELKKAESDKLLDFFTYHIHSADDHAVRWKWAVGSVAMWDNRYDTLTSALIQLKFKQAMFWRRQAYSASIDAPSTVSSPERTKHPDGAFERLSLARSVSIPQAAS